MWLFCALCALAGALGSQCLAIRNMRRKEGLSQGEKDGKTRWCCYMSLAITELGSCCTVQKCLGSGITPIRLLPTGFNVPVYINRKSGFFFYTLIVMTSFPVKDRWIACTGITVVKTWL